MSTTLGPDEMRALAQKHGDCEVAHDWSGALGTMTDTPFYEFYPFRLRISGPDAITAMWQRLFPPEGTLRCFNESFIVPEAYERDEYVNDDALVHIQTWDFFTEAGEQTKTKSVVRYQFEGEGMQSETMFVDHAAMPYLDRVFDTDFRSLPGVEEI